MIELTERFLHRVRVERPPVTETVAEARARLADTFPRPALRRMTHLGLLLGSTLDGLALTPDDAVIYATSYAETRALEDFLTSFPAASPLLFQTSIHPGGVQQVLIGRQQPIARLWPLAGRDGLVEQALLTCLLESAPRSILLGGEERGTWLLDHGVASDRAFAFAAQLRRDATGAAAKLTLRPQRSHPADGARQDREPTDAFTEPATCPTLPAFADALAERRPLAWRGDSGDWTLAWL